MRRRTYLTTIVGLTVTAGCPTDSSSNSRGNVVCDGMTVTPETEGEAGSITGSWPRPHFDRRNTSHDPDATAPDGCPRTRWHADIETIVHRAPAVVDGTLYAVSGALLGIDAATGEIQHRHDGDFLSAPTVVEGTAYIGGRNQVSATDVTSGQLQWRVATGDENSWPAPTYADGTIYTGSDLGEALAIAADGHVRWRRRFAASGDRTETESTRDGVDVKGAPAIGTNAVYVGTRGADQALYALDRATGDTLWRRSVSGGVWTAPVLGTDHVFVGDDHVSAIRRDDGAIAWRLLDDSGEVVGSPALADGTLYVQAGPALDAIALYALDAATGDVEWQRSIAIPEATPRVADGQVFLGSGSDLLALDAASGEPRWTMDPDADIHGGPVIVDGTVFLNATESGIFAVR